MTSTETAPQQLLNSIEVAASLNRIRTGRRSYAGCHAEYGDVLNNEKQLVGHGNWLKHLLASGVPKDEAEDCMRIASNPVTGNTANLLFLPSARSSQVFLTKQDPEVVQDLIDKEQINADMTEAQVKALFFGPVDAHKGWKPPRSILDASSKLYKVKEINEAKGQARSAWRGAVVAWPPLTGKGVQDWWGFFYEAWNTGTLTAAILLTPLDIATTNRFTTAANESCALCFPLGKLGVPERPLVAFYFGDNAADFGAAFIDIGPVLTPLALTRSNT